MAHKKHTQFLTAYCLLFPNGTRNMIRFHLLWSPYKTRNTLILIKTFPFSLEQWTTTWKQRFWALVLNSRSRCIFRDKIVSFGYEKNIKWQLWYSLLILNHWFQSCVIFPVVVFVLTELMNKWWKSFLDNSLLVAHFRVFADQVLQHQKFHCCHVHQYFIAW